MTLVSISSYNIQNNILTVTSYTCSLFITMQAIMYRKKKSIAEEVEMALRYRQEKKQLSYVQLSERLATLGIMGNQINVSP